MVKNKSKKPKKHKYWTVKFFKVLIILYVVSLFMPFAHGYSTFPLAFVKCGFKEPYIASSFLNGQTYSTPGDGYYFGPNIFTRWDDYYCTSKEAERAGFSDYSWGKESCKYYDDTNHTLCIDGKSGYIAMVPYFVLLLFAATVITTVRMKTRRKKPVE